MNFRESLTQFQFLSELYYQDVPKAVLLAEYPSSNNPETQFSNVNRFVIHDPFPPPPRKLLKELGPHHLMAGWGRHLPITSEVAPSESLLEHWRRVFGDAGVPQYHPYDPSADFITLYPHESISSERQLVAPDALHRMHSKEIISSIQCPQPKILGQIRPPCVIKLSHGYAGLGNYFVRNEADAESAKKQINSCWPNAKLVFTEIVEDVVGDFGVQFYLDSKGQSTLVGFTEQQFDANKKWTGGDFSLNQQESSLTDSFTEFIDATASVLHQGGYFGLVGIDILQSANNQFFLVDVNPRLTGITPFLIASRLSVAEGTECGVYRASCKITASVTQVMEAADTELHNRIIVFGITSGNLPNESICHLSVSGDCIAECQNVLDRFVRRGT